MEGEELKVLDAVAGLEKGWASAFLIIAPRHPERFDAVANLLGQRKISFVRRTRIEQVPAKVDVVLIDTIGELSRAYRMARVAFIGGSLVPTGGHNPLEPAVWGAPVLTGPHIDNFREVYDELFAAAGARVVEDTAALSAALAGWLADPDGRARAGRAAQAVVENNRGASDRTVAALLALCDQQ